LIAAPAPSTRDLASALAAVGDTIEGIRDEQWPASTPCAEWSVRDVVGHVVGMNLVFAALLTGETPPERGVDRMGEDPACAYRASSAGLMAAFDQPGVLQHTFHGPLGAATGIDRLQIRLYDLVAHGGDLAETTGQPVKLPDGLARQALTFARAQLSGHPRTGRFDPAQPISADAPAIDQLAAFLGRSVNRV